MAQTFRCSMRTGLIVAPGFFDIHVHLREPGTEEAETIATGGNAAVAGGFTAVAAMPNTKPPNDNPSITHYIVSEAKRSSPARVFPIGAITKEQKGETLAEIGEMFEAGIVGISDDGKPVMDGQLFRRALEYAQMFDMPVIQHCEDLNLSKGGVMHEGAYSTRLGLKGIPAAAEETMVSRDLILAEMTGGKYHVAHLSTRRAVEMVREAKRAGFEDLGRSDTASLHADGCCRRGVRHECEDESAASFAGRCRCHRRRNPGRDDRRDCQRSRSTSHQSEDAGIRPRAVRHHRTGNSRRPGVDATSAADSRGSSNCSPSIRKES